MEEQQKDLGRSTDSRSRERATTPRHSVISLMSLSLSLSLSVSLTLSLTLFVSRRHLIPSSLSPSQPFLTPNNNLTTTTNIKIPRNHHEILHFKLWFYFSFNIRWVNFAKLTDYKLESYTFELGFLVIITVTTDNTIFTIHGENNENLRHTLTLEKKKQASWVRNPPVYLFIIVCSQGHIVNCHNETLQWHN